MYKNLLRIILKKIPTDDAFFERPIWSAQTRTKCCQCISREISFRLKVYYGIFLILFVSVDPDLYVSENVE